MELINHPIVKQLLSLKLPPKDYVIFGSGPMFAHGIRPLEQLGDLDLVARGEAWENSKQTGTLVQHSERQWGVTSIELFGGTIEVFDEWGPGDYDINKLIDEAEVIQDLPFVPLTKVLRWKKDMGRPKDLQHAKMISRFLDEQVPRWGK